MECFATAVMDCGPFDDKILDPLLKFARGVLGILSPEPGICGSCANSVEFVCPLNRGRKRGKLLDEKPTLSTELPAFTAFQSEIADNTTWQKMHMEYVKYMGVEADDCDACDGSETLPGLKQRRDFSEREHKNKRESSNK